MSSSGVSITNLDKEMKHVKDKKEVGQLDMVGVKKDTRGNPSTIVIYPQCNLSI